MRIKKQLIICLTSLVIVLGLPACSNSQSCQLANEMSFSLNHISEIIISYDDENVTFYESEGSELIIKEYMTENKSNYYAKIDQSDDSIKISEGGKPMLKDSFFRYIEVYLPSSYHENLMVTTTDGDIDISGMELDLKSLRIDSTAGTVKLKEVAAGNIHLSSTSGVLELGSLHGDTMKIDTTSADVTCEKMDGNVAYMTTSGNAYIKSAIGSGSYKANNSGDLEVTYTEVNDNLSFYNKNDNVSVTLPADLEFKFVATTKNGSVSTSFQEWLAMDDQTVSGIVGNNPAVTIEVETKNGNIEVRQ